MALMTIQINYNTNGSIVTGIHDGSEYDYCIVGNFVRYTFCGWVLCNVSWVQF